MKFLSSKEVLHSLICYREDDTKWPEKNKDGRQELEIRLGNEHISFEVRYHLQIGTFFDDCLADDYNRLQRLVLWLMLPNLQIRKACVFSTI